MRAGVELAGNDDQCKEVVHVVCELAHAVMQSALTSPQAVNMG